MRVDIHLPDGTSVASRDDVRPDPRDWPTSFSVTTWEESTTVFVRLRAYPEGRTISYRGIVYAPPETLVHGTPAGDDQPRLMVDGEDRTPPLEPNPLVTVDRVDRVPVRFGQQKRVRIKLHGACVALMPQLRPWDDVSSCTDGTTELQPLEEPVLESDLSHDLPSEAGTWGHQPCPEDVGPDRACAPG
ncbi:MAG: hypothetical protein ACOC1F_07705, partial [Myxococcota bacterium]